MSAPLYDALRALCQKKTIRFHMPGHKGQPVLPDFSPILPLDFTEIYETGNLYTGEGPIRLAEEQAARFYHTTDCHFLTGGSSQGIHAMLYAAAGCGGSVLFDRNCHKSCAHAAAMLDLTPTFVFPEILEPYGIPALLDPCAIDAALKQSPQIQTVLITSPNYYGICQDIPAIASICHTHGAKLVVDAAHGAHFPAVGLPSPIQQGADLAVLSAHKTLYAMGQAAMILSNGTIDGEKLREGAALFGTSSPSYAILASLDLARDLLEQDDSYQRTAQAVKQLKVRLSQTRFLPLSAGISLDPCRLTISTAGTNLSGNALSDRLYARFGIACEMSDLRNLVCIVTPADLPQNLTLLEQALLALSQEVQPFPQPTPLAPLPHPKPVLSVRRAMLGACDALPLSEVRSGMVCARPVTPYPPGVPVLWPGEEITRQHIVFLTNQCYNTVSRVFLHMQ